MPANQTVIQSLKLIETDPSKILSLAVGNHNPMPDAYIPKAGESYVSSLKTAITNSTPTVTQAQCSQPANVPYFQDAQEPPTLSFSLVSPSTTYLAIALDIDAPFPTLPILGPILHWIQPGLRSDSKSVPGQLRALEPFIANYIGPAPPPGSAPHRYVFLLYEQPPAFEAKRFAPPGGANLSNWNRMWWSLDEWEREAGLGEVLAVTYFVSN